MPDLQYIPYLDAVIENTLKELELCDSGRNNALNKAVFSIFKFGYTDYIQEKENEIIGRINHIMVKHGLKEKEIERTINSSLKAAEKKPCELPKDYEKDIKLTTKDFQDEMKPLKEDKKNIEFRLKRTKKMIRESRKAGDDLHALDLEKTILPNIIEDLKRADNEILKQKEIIEKIKEVELLEKKLAMDEQINEFKTDIKGQFLRKRVFMDGPHYVVCDTKAINPIFSEKQLEILTLTLFNLDHLRLRYPKLKNIRSELMDAMRELKSIIPPIKYTNNPTRKYGEVFLKNGESVVNIYKDNGLISKCEADFSLTYDDFPNIYFHLKHLYDNHLEYIIDVFSYKFQNPEVLPCVAIINISVEGAGKGLLYLLLKRIFGSNNSISVNQYSIESSFNSYSDKILICLEEIELKSNKVAEKLKNLIADPYISINKKYQTEKTIENIAFYVINTNKEIPIFISTEDRRYFVAYLENKMDEEKGFNLAELYESSDTTEIEAFIRFCLARDVNKLSIRPPRTVKRNEIAKYSLGEKFHIIEQILSPNILDIIDLKKQGISSSHLDILNSVKNRIVEKENTINIWTLDVPKLARILFNQEINDYKINPKLKYLENVKYTTFKNHEGKQFKGYVINKTKEQTIEEMYDEA